MENIKLVDPKGREVRLNSWQKNQIYKKAKEMREGLSDKLCTQRECRNPTKENVNKMLNSEFKAGTQMDIYRKSMQAIGADPKDCDVERLRRR